MVMGTSRLGYFVEEFNKRKRKMLRQVMVCRLFAFESFPNPIFTDFQLSYRILGNKKGYT